jgi:hypothetical protein
MRKFLHVFLLAPKEMGSETPRVWRPLTTLNVCLLGLVLGAAVYVPVRRAAGRGRQGAPS